MSAIRGTITLRKRFVLKIIAFATAALIAAAAITIIKKDASQRLCHNSGEMKESFIALNVCACEVSCRAGTIKCSHLASHGRPMLAPIRLHRKIGSPADRTRARSFGRQKLQQEIIKPPQ